MRFALALTALLIAMPAGADHATGSSLIDYYVNQNDVRTEKQKARDQYRHPSETLAFFGVQPGMTVTEQLPGWYTEIVGPMLAKSGTYVGVNVHPDNYTNDDAERRARRLAWADNFVERRDYLGDTAKAAFLAGEDNGLADDSVDVALVIRAMHGMVGGGVADKVLADYFRILKPGGVLGIVQHRDDETSGLSTTGNRGYLKQSDVIDMVTKAGFVLLASSEINANPKDIKTYEGGVWTLPPVLRLGDTDRGYYQSIGESDRMTLKFIKPIS